MKIAQFELVDIGVPNVGAGQDLHDRDFFILESEDYRSRWLNTRKNLRTTSKGAERNAHRAQLAECRLKMTQRDFDDLAYITDIYKSVVDAAVTALGQAKVALVLAKKSGDHLDFSIGELNEAMLHMSNLTEQL